MPSISSIGVGVKSGGERIPQRPDARIHISQRTDPGQPVRLPARTLSPLSWRQVRKRAQPRLWNEYIQHYRYLGYKTLPGAQLRYFVYAAEHPVALLGQTKGRGKLGPAGKQSVPIKDLWVYPLHRHFQEMLRR